MKKLVVLATLVFASVPAFAHYHGNDRAIGPARGSYYMNARGASCDGARDAVYESGAIILHYGYDLYDRVVRDGSFCSHEQVTKPLYADGCFVGYTCENSSGGFEGGTGGF